MLTTRFLIILFLFISCQSDVKLKHADSQLVLLSSKTIRLKPDIVKLMRYAKEANQFCQQKQLNTQFFLLVDIGLHSGIKRFFIWDFKKDTIVNSFLVSHGCGKNAWARDYSKDNALVSNIDGTHCSSIGKYIIGERGYSNWGIHVNYLLYGQDTTNSNALKRQIVLHSWDKIADKEVYPNGTPEGWGCPAVADNSLRIIDAKLKASNKRTLLWIVK